MDSADCKQSGTTSATEAMAAPTDPDNPPDPPIASTSTAARPPPSTTFHHLVKNREAHLAYLRAQHAGRPTLTDEAQAAVTSTFAALADSSSAKAVATYRTTWTSFVTFAEIHGIEAVPDVLRVAMFLVEGRTEAGPAITYTAAHNHVLPRLEKIRAGAFTNTTAPLPTSLLIVDVLARGWVVKVPDDIAHASPELIEKIMEQRSGAVTELGLGPDSDVPELMAKRPQAFALLRREGIDDEYLLYCKRRFNFACGANQPSNTALDACLGRYVRFCSSQNIPSYPVDELRATYYLLSRLSNTLKKSAATSARTDARALYHLGRLCVEGAYPDVSSLRRGSWALLNRVDDQFKAFEKQKPASAAESSPDVFLSEPPIASIPVKPGLSLPMPTPEVVEMLTTDASDVMSDLQLRTVDDLRDKADQIMTMLRVECVEEPLYEFCRDRVQHLLADSKTRQNKNGGSITAFYDAYITFYGYANVAPLPVDELKVANFVYQNAMYANTGASWSLDTVGQLNDWTIFGRRFIAACSEVDCGPKALALRDNHLPLLKQVVDALRKTLPAKKAEKAARPAKQEPGLVRPLLSPVLSTGPAAVPPSPISSAGEVASMLLDPKEGTVTADSTPPASAKRSWSPATAIALARKRPRISGPKAQLRAARILDSFRPVGIHYSAEHVLAVVDGLNEVLGRF